MDDEQAVSLELVSAMLRAIQAEQHTLRLESGLLRETMSRELAHLATRDQLVEVLRALSDRMGNFEAVMQSRFDLLSGQLAALSANLSR